MDKDNKIPVFLIEAKNIPEAFEKAMEKVWSVGLSIKTQYDNPGDPPSKDASVNIVIENPYNQPRFHRAIIDGLGGLAEYVQEVVNGAHDYWIKPKEEILKGKESKDTRWEYTYHKRLFEFETESGVINQIDTIIKRLFESPYTRRAQAITWNPLYDSLADDPPCLQRVWCRCVEADNKFYVNMQTDWRSRDLYKAWVENVIALTTLHQRIVDDLNRREKEGGGKRQFVVGQYTDKSNSLHIYGKDFYQIEGDKEKGTKNFFEVLEKRNLEDRTYTSSYVREFFIDDGIGKGLECMLKREQEMPLDVGEKVLLDLRRLKDGSYTP